MSRHKGIYDDIIKGVRTRKRLDSLKKRWHIGSQLHAPCIDVENLVLEVERSWARTRRLKVQLMELKAWCRQS